MSAPRSEPRGMNRLEYRLWGLAEWARWYRLPPRRFWRWLERHYDRKAGYIQ